MTEDQEEINKEGYNAFLDNQKECSNPYSGIDAEYWSDGWEDAADDDRERTAKSNQEYADTVTPEFVAEQNALQDKALSGVHINARNSA